jgi:hypothetical protein
MTIKQRIRLFEWIKPPSRTWRNYIEGSPDIIATKGLIFLKDPIDQPRGSLGQCARGVEEVEMSRHPNNIFESLRVGEYGH